MKRTIFSKNKKPDLISILVFAFFMLTIGLVSPVSAVSPDVVNIGVGTNGNYVVMCRTGGRSAQICEFLTNQKFCSVSNLSGGINEWARKIDTSLPAY